MYKTAFRIEVSGMADEEQEEISDKTTKPKMQNKKVIIAAIVVVIIIIIAAVLVTRDGGIGNGNGDDRNHTPIANGGEKTREVMVGETVKFSAKNSSDVDGDELTYSWDFEGDILTGMEVTYTFDVAGMVNVTLTVSDGKAQDLFEIEVTVKSESEITEPTISLRSIPDSLLTPEKIYGVVVQSAKPVELIDNFTFAIIDSDTGAVLFKNDVKAILNTQGNVTFIDSPPVMNRLDVGDEFTISPDGVMLDAGDGDKFVLYYKMGDGSKKQVAEAEFESTSLP